MAQLNWPNRVTLLRFLFVVPFFCFLIKINDGWLGWRYLAAGLFLLMATTDWVDGLLARRLHQETALGRVLDPLADKFLVLVAILALAVPSTAVAGYRIPTWVPAVVIIKDVLSAIGVAMVLRRTGGTLPRPRALGKASTAVQFILVGFTLLAPEIEPHVPDSGRVHRGLCWASVCLAGLAMVDYATAAFRTKRVPATRPQAATSRGA